MRFDAPMIDECIHPYLRDVQDHVIRAVESIDNLLELVKSALEAAGIKPLSAEVAMIASANVSLSGEKADQMVALIEALEEHDDVQKVHTNFELSEADMARMSG